VYVFTRSGSTWLQLQELTAPVGATSFGWSVALSADGSTALIGAPSNTSQTDAYVFTLSGSTWSQQQVLEASVIVANYNFGLSVALSADGSTALIGASAKNSSQGAAYVFTRSGSKWSQQQELTASDSVAAQNDFGLSVALSADGNTALIGASNKNSFTGTAYVFTRSGSTWSQQQKLTASDSAAQDDFGRFVALSADGNTALIGAFNKNSFKGAAYVFTRSGPKWSQQQELTASDSVEQDHFGRSVALSADGNTALIGAFNKNFTKGVAYVFMRSGSTWSQQQELTASDAVAGNLFGISVALNADGKTALIGAGAKNSFQGVAYMFTRSGPAWSQQQELTASDAAVFDHFGLSMALSDGGKTALIGAFSKNSGAGVAYVFHEGGMSRSLLTSSLHTCRSCSVSRMTVVVLESFRRANTAHSSRFSKSDLPFSS
jgi:hypothetical protein